MNDDEDGRALPLLSLSLVPVVLSPSRCGMRARRRSWERRAATGARPPAFRSGDRTGTTNERTRERGGESSTRRYPSRKRFRTRICHHKLVLLRVACRQLLILRWPKHSRGSPGPMRAAPTRSQIPSVGPSRCRRRRCISGFVHGAHNFVTEVPGGPTITQH